MSTARTAPAPVTAAALQGAAASGAVWTVVHTVVSVPLAFAANAVVARALGPTGYGRLAVVTLVLGVATSLTNLGVTDAALQWGAAAHARGDSATVDGMLRRVLGFAVLVQLPLLLVTVLVVLRGSSPAAVAAALLGVALSMAVGPASLAATIESRTAGGAKITMATNVVLQAVVAAAAVLTRSPAHVWAARSAAGGLLQGAYYLLLGPARRRALARPLPPRGLPAGFWRFALLTAAGGVVGMLVFSRSELLVLDASHAAAAAGLFALAFGLSQQVTAPVDAMLNPLSPAVAGIVAAHPQRAPHTLLRSTRVAAVMAAALVAVVFPALYVALPVIYGDRFTAAADIFLPLGVASCVQSVVNPLLTFARARRRSGALLTINCVALVLDLAVAVALVPLIGVWGAVVANVAGQLAVLAPMARMECRHWSVPAAAYLRALGPFAVSVPAMLVAALAVPGWLGLPPAVGSVVAALAGGVAVVAGVRLTGTGIPAADLEPGLRILPGPAQRVARPVARLLTSPAVAGGS